MSWSAEPIEAVIFDWGGTLTPWHTVDLVKQWHVYAERYTGGNQAEVVELAERILAAEDKAWSRIRADGRSAHLLEVLESAGVDADHPGHEAGMAAYEEFWEPHTLTDPQVKPLFTALRDRKIKVGVLSNTIWSADYHRQVFARDGVEDLIDGAVYTSDLSHAKPHRVAFASAMAAVGVDVPERCVFVGDRPYEDVHGAQAVGMRAILIPHSDIPAAQQVPVEVTPDGVAHELMDVLTIIQTWQAEGAHRLGA